MGGIVADMGATRTASWYLAKKVLPRQERGKAGVRDTPHPSLWSSTAA